MKRPSFIESTLWSMNWNNNRKTVDDDDDNIFVIQTVFIFCFKELLPYLKQAMQDTDWNRVLNYDFSFRGEIKHFHIILRIDTAHISLNIQVAFVYCIWISLRLFSIKQSFLKPKIPCKTVINFLKSVTGDGKKKTYKTELIICTKRVVEFEFILWSSHFSLFTVITFYIWYTQSGRVDWWYMRTP